ncbi:MAG TPA: proline dehydrogenase family protein, partial [Acidimicrobiales bacterium]|nr:proline dehydrogenase family protein [Acidimicrobiales bacterium]
MPEAPGLTDDQSLIDRAEDIAAQLVADAARLETGEDKRRRARIAGLVTAPEGQEFLTALTDQVLRIKDRRRAAQRLNALVDDLGVPSWARGLDRASLLAASRLAPVAPMIVMPAVSFRLRHEFSATVLSAKPSALSNHVRRRRAQDARLNVNVLGEAILGESEAVARTNAIVDLLGRPDVDYVSVKISAICSRLDVIAYEDSTSRIVERLGQIFRAALASRPPKFVNLDMEEYRDLELTIDAFTRALSQPAFVGVDAGIALQAYLPDSYTALQRVAAFARDRHQSHGSVVKVRLVKGANLAMERVESQLRGWPQAPFTTKADVDANFKRLLDRAIDPSNQGALRVGVASHNLFDVGWALAVREATGAAIELEMLEGMANPQALATARLAGGILLYAPIVELDDFASAVAYLVRRFDENTSPENFLAHLFDLTVGSPAWELERGKFRAAVAGRHGPPPRSRRAEAGGTTAMFESPVFANTADTDFTVKANRLRLKEAMER